MKKCLPMVNGRKRLNRLIGMITVFALVFVQFIPTDAVIAETIDFKQDIAYYGVSSYSAYFSAHSDAPYPETTITLQGADARVNGLLPETVTDYEGSKGVSAYMYESDTMNWEFAVESEGLYVMRWEYYPIEGNGSSIERCILIDGELPFSEAGNCSFIRLWKNSDEAIKKDTQGNQIMIEQLESPAWMTQYASVSGGSSASPYLFYLSKGTHTLSVEAILEPMLLRTIVFCPVFEVQSPSYLEYRQQNEVSSVSDKAVVTLQGEEANFKSEQTLYPVADKTSPSVEPYDCVRTVYNSIGGSQWTNIGQWIEWSFYVPETGAYTLAAHFKQSLKENGSSVRAVYIDGKIPFSEAKNWMFPYDTKWQCERFCDDNGNSYLFYLEEGYHTLRLEVGTGKYSDVITQARELLNRLNAVYRSIIVVTGVNPDQYRDYKLEQTIPETVADMKMLSSDIKTFEKRLKSLEDTESSISDVKRIYEQLDMMLEDTDTIAVRLTSFKDNIATFGTWINALQGQPLVLDWVCFSSADFELQNGEAGFFSLLVHHLKAFVSSFVVDYEMIGQQQELSEAALKVWMTSTKDHANVLRNMTVNDFTADTNIPVTVQLVATSALFPSIIAGNGPDIALGIAQSEVNNLALRNAVYDLSLFPDYEEICNEFYSHSLVPFEFNGGSYALPETEVWPMLFYRKDILSEINITAEELSTWDSLLHSVLPKLKKNSLDFGLMPSIQNYLNFVYQKGGSLYIDNGKSSGLSSAAAIQSMKEFTMLYDQYGLDLSFDFANRFRTGEMPIAVVDFTMYNNLQVFASEIKGLWGMLPIPGTVRQDGSIDRSAVATLTGSVMLSGTDKSEEAWEFMKWWSSAKTQNNYGTQIEAIVGMGARYNSANKTAIKQTNWEPDMRNALLFQAEAAKAYPEVPGGYFTSRLFSFAFRSIIYEEDDVRVTMDDLAKDIDREMNNKRSEYFLN